MALALNQAKKGHSYEVVLECPFWIFVNYSHLQSEGFPHLEIMRF